MSFNLFILIVVSLLALFCPLSQAAGKNYCLWSTGCNPGLTGITAPVESDCAPGLICLQTQTPGDLTSTYSICLEDKNLLTAPAPCVNTNEAGANPCCNIRATKIGVGAAAVCRLGTAGICTQRSL